MAYSNADQQRLRAQGWVQVQGWVTPAQAEAIRRARRHAPIGAE